MTPTRDRLPERLYPLLPSCDGRIRSVAVFHEVKRGTGLQDAMQLAKRGTDIRDRAQRPRGQYGIESLGREVQSLAAQSGWLHRHVVLLHPRSRHAH
jgi:hypothetical protein